MRQVTLDRLCCPHCCGALKTQRVVRQTRDDALEFGLVACEECGATYPVVARVLLLGSPEDHVAPSADVGERLRLQIPTLEYLCHLLRENDAVGAFTAVLAPSGAEPDLLFRAPRSTSRGAAAVAAKPPLQTGIQLRLNRFTRGRLLRLAQDRLARTLLSGLDRLSAKEVIALYYDSFSRQELGSELLLRFGQPRHLAALGLAALVKCHQGVIFELACGAGHLTHFLSSQERHVIGADRHYFPLFVGANYLARSADFVWLLPDRPLPFRDTSLGGAVCSGVFGDLADKSGCIRELSRVVADEGLVAIVRAGNAACAPYDPSELTPSQYAKLCAGLNCRFYGEEELVAAYLAKRYPSVDGAKAAPEPLLGEKWLSMVLAKQASALAHPDSFDLMLRESARADARQS